MKKKNFVDVKMALPENILLKLCLQAHEKNVTLNEYVNLILKDYMRMP